MRAIFLLSSVVCLSACSNLLQSGKDLLQSLNKPASVAQHNDRDCLIRKYLIGWGKEYKEGNSSPFVSSYGIMTDQGKLHVDDGAVFRDIMSRQGQEVALLMSSAAGDWIVDLPNNDKRMRLRASVMCHPGYPQALSPGENRP